MPRAVLALLVIVVLALAAAAAQSAPGAAADRAQEPPAAAAKDPAGAPLARARRLAAQWGRCADARPAHRLLGIAARTRPPRPRVLRARAAVRAWRTVARECAKPVDAPTVFVAPAASTTAPAV